MKVDSDRLRTLRKRKKLSRPDLERASGITMRTIQRLENEPDKSKTTREDTVMRLADALEVEPGVLTGEFALPESETATVAEPDPVRIGAQIAPKVRLAYDLIKRRYGVNATDIINMAPLFFTLLAEGSLAWRRKKSTEASEARTQLEQVDGFWRKGLGTGLYDFIDEGIGQEDESILKADLFGERLLEDTGSLVDGFPFFDPSMENPFATYLRKLCTDLAIPGVVDVDGELSFGSPRTFPDYNINSDEISRIANGSVSAKKALETGFARLPDVPDELMAEDKDAERQQWLENRLAPFYKDPKMDVVAHITAVSPTGDNLRDLLKDVRPEEDDSQKKEEGDDQ